MNQLLRMRFLQLQRRCFFNFISKSMNISLNREHIILFNATSSLPHNNWQMFSDVEYGGNSKCVSEMKNEVGEYDQFARFSGQIIFNRQPDVKAAKDARIPTRGFCAFKYNFKSILDLRDTEGLEVILRSATNRTFIFNMSCVSLFEGDIYQIALELPAEKWVCMQIPYEALRLTANGRERDVQRANDSLQLEAISFLVDSGSDPFVLDLASITAVPDINRMPQRRPPK